MPGFIKICFKHQKGRNENCLASVIKTNEYFLELIYENKQSQAYFLYFKIIFFGENGSHATKLDLLKYNSYDKSLIILFVFFKLSKAASQIVLQAATQLMRLQVKLMAPYVFKGVPLLVKSSIILIQETKYTH